MKALVKIFVASVLVLFPNMVLAEQTLLLNLKYKSDNIVTNEIKFYGNDIDPNSSSINDQFSLYIDNQIINIPRSIYSKIESLRRSFSYDNLSGGIQQNAVTSICFLGGASSGITLEARYLTYQDYRIISSQMRPVFSLASNCLFTENYSPINSYAREDARAVVEILDTIKLFLVKDHE